MRSIVLSLLGLCMLPGPALAYRTFTDLPQLDDAQGEPVAWPSFPIALEVAIDDDAPISTAETKAALERATELWNEATCTEDAFESSVETDFAGSSDGYNTVQWIHSDWSSLGGPNVIAVTQPVYEVMVGRYVLVEADVFLNAETVSWTDDLVDHLDGVLAHELGHVLGLAHPCEPDGADGAPLCEAGVDADTLMHPLYDPARAELTDDDEAGTCFLYPELRGVADPASGSDGGGCTIAGPARTGSQRFVFVMMLGVALAARALRRRPHAR
jgi:hypothetical protein